MDNSYCDFINQFTDVDHIIWNIISGKYYNEFKDPIDYVLQKRKETNNVLFNDRGNYRENLNKEEIKYIRGKQEKLEEKISRDFYRKYKFSCYENLWEYLKTYYNEYKDQITKAEKDVSIKQKLIDNFKENHMPIYENILFNNSFRKQEIKEEKKAISKQVLKNKNKAKEDFVAKIQKDLGISLKDDAYKGFYCDKVSGGSDGWKTPTYYQIHLTQEKSSLKEMVDILVEYNISSNGKIINIELIDKSKGMVTKYFSDGIIGTCTDFVYDKKYDNYDTFIKDFKELLSEKRVIKNNESLDDKILSFDNSEKVSFEDQFAIKNQQQLAPIIKQKIEKRRNNGISELLDKLIKDKKAKKIKKKKNKLVRIKKDYKDIQKLNQVFSDNLLSTKEKKDVSNKSFVSADDIYNDTLSDIISEMKSISKKGKNKEKREHI